MKFSTKIALGMIVVGLFFATRSRAMSSRARGVTDDQLRRIDGRVRRQFASALNPAMEAGDITTTPRVAAFLGQILHETGGFQWLKELASGEAYEGRASLGNTQPGDGPKYKGRGFIQLTGRANYRQAGADLGLPLEENPELVMDPAIAARTAVWFWTKKRLNARADVGDVRGITRVINGGEKGLEERTQLTNNALNVLSSGALVG